jgi:hypothetical protein
MKNNFQLLSLLSILSSLASPQTSFTQDLSTSATPDPSKARSAAAVNDSPNVFDSEIRLSGDLLVRISAAAVPCA